MMTESESNEILQAINVHVDLKITEASKAIAQAVCDALIPALLKMVNEAGNEFIRKLKEQIRRDPDDWWRGEE